MTRRTPDARISPSDFLGALGHLSVGLSDGPAWALPISLRAPPNPFVSHRRENVLFRQARNFGKLRNSVRCEDRTVRPGGGSAAWMKHTIWSQRARAMQIRLGDHNADCSVSPSRSHQRKTGCGYTSDR